MSFFKKQRLLLIGVGLIVLTNAIALAGVAYNRAGSLESVLQLSERELSYYKGEHEDNSGISVNFDWTVMNESATDVEYYSWRNYSRRADWLNTAKLKQLGFDVRNPSFSTSAPDSSDSLKDREVFLVLEFNGPAYQRYLQAAKALAKTQVDKKAAADDIAEAETKDTRLFVIDAGTQADSLRKLYPKGKMHVIVKGIVSARWEKTDEKIELLGYIKSLSISTLHVSKPHDVVFNAIPANDASGKYQVRVAYGQRHEPWILSVTK